MAGSIRERVRLAGSAILVTVLLLACGPGPVTVTVQQLDAKRARWIAMPVRSYHIVVDVERPGDRRRNTITVVESTLNESSVAYWNEKERGWGSPQELTIEQATPFTVPGLFDLIRQELLEGHRSDCRVAFVGDPPVPGRILLGPVMQPGGPVPGSEATIIVRGFEPLSPATRQ